MTTVAEFSTIEVLPSGQRVEIRALTPADREDMLAAVGRTSTQSIYRRFFNVRRARLMAARSSQDLARFSAFAASIGRQQRYFPRYAINLCLMLDLSALFHLFDRLKNRFPVDNQHLRRLQNAIPKATKRFQPSGDF
jgi:hypothetical protein